MRCACCTRCKKRARGKQHDAQLERIAVGCTQIDQAVAVYRRKLAGLLPWTEFRPPPLKGAA